MPGYPQIIQGGANLAGQFLEPQEPVSWRGGRFRRRIGWEMKLRPSTEARELMQSKRWPPCLPARSISNGQITYPDFMCGSSNECHQLPPDNEVFRTTGSYQSFDCSNLSVALSASTQT